MNWIFIATDTGMLLHSKAGGAELPGEPQATVVPLGITSTPFCLFLSGFSWSTCLSRGSNGCCPKSIHPKLFPVSFPFSMQYLSLSQNKHFRDTQVLPSHTSSTDTLFWLPYMPHTSQPYPSPASPLEPPAEGQLQLPNITSS